MAHAMLNLWPDLRFEKFRFAMNVSSGLFLDAWASQEPMVSVTHIHPSLTLFDTILIDSPSSTIQARFKHASSTLQARFKPASSKLQASFKQASSMLLNVSYFQRSHHSYPSIGGPVYVMAISMVDALFASWLMSYLSVSVCVRFEDCILVHNLSLTRIIQSILMS